MFSQSIALIVFSCIIIGMLVRKHSVKSGLYTAPILLMPVARMLIYPLTSVLLPVRQSAAGLPEHFVRVIIYVIFLVVACVIIGMLSAFIKNKRARIAYAVSFCSYSAFLALAYIKEVMMSV